MHHVRTTRGTYVAAFLLGVLIALLLVAPARSAMPASPGPVLAGGV